MSTKGRDTFPLSGDRSSTGAGSSLKKYGQSLGDEIKGLLRLDSMKGIFSRPEGPRIPPKSSSSRNDDSPSGSGSGYAGRSVPGSQRRSSRDGHTQEYDSHGNQDQSPRVSASSLNVNVSPRNKRVSYHDGYSEPSQNEDEEVGKRDRNLGLEHKAPPQWIESSKAYKPTATRTLHDATRACNSGGSPYVPMSSHGGAGCSGGTDYSHGYSAYDAGCGGGGGGGGNDGGGGC